jgi:general secretion pathway protein I
MAAVLRFPRFSLRRCRARALHTRFHRAGMTLLEIVLALALFFGALAMLSQLLWNGTRAAVQGRLQTQALIRAEAKLNELLVGAEMRQPQANVPFADDNQWKWSLVIQPTQFPELEQLEVTVSHQGKAALANTSVKLSRWARAPEVYAAALEEREEALSESSKADEQGAIQQQGSN